MCLHKYIIIAYIIPFCTLYAIQSIDSWGYTFFDHLIGVAQRTKSYHWDDGDITQPKPIEDRFFVGHKDNKLICGVCDGHGGSQAAEFIRQSFLNHLTDNLKQTFINANSMN